MTYYYGCDDLIDVAQTRPNILDIIYIILPAFSTSNLISAVTSLPPTATEVTITDIGSLIRELIAFVITLIKHLVNLL